MDASLPTPPGARKVLSSALIDVGNAWRDIGSRLIEATPAVGSEVESMLAGRTLGETCLAPVPGSLGAASDSYQAFARLLRLEEIFGPSIATLARSTIEALGRAWWVMDAADSAAAEHRAALMALRELKAASRYSTSSFREVTADGAFIEVTPEHAVERAQKRFDAVMVPTEPAAVPGYTALAVDVMTAGGVTDARAEYSHYSGIAHGEGLIVGGMSAVSIVDNVKVGSLGLPISNLYMYLWTLLHTTDTVMTKWIDMWGIHAERERWDQRRERAYDTVSKIREMLRAWDPATQGFDWDAAQGRSGAHTFHET